MSANKTVTANFASTVPIQVVDNANPTFTGAWVLDSGSAGTGFFASDFRYASTVSFPNATATFRPNLPMAGNYDVQVFYPNINQGGRRCRDARHVVFFDGGAVRVSWTRPAEAIVLEETGAITSSPVTGWSLVTPATYQTNATHSSITIPHAHRNAGVPAAEAIKARQGSA